MQATLCKDSGSLGVACSLQCGSRFQSAAHGACSSVILNEIVWGHGARAQLRFELCLVLDAQEGLRTWRRSHDRISTELRRPI